MDALPRGRHGLSREEVELSQRTRLLRAMIELGTECGFPSLTLTDIVGRAGVARSTFYEHFENKEQCFLAAFDYAAQTVLERVLAPGVPPGDDLAVRIPAYITRLLELATEEPALTRLFVSDASALGPAAARHQRAIRARLATGLVALRDFLRQAEPSLVPISHIRAVAVVGAIVEVIQHTLYATGIEALPALHKELTTIVLALLASEPLLNQPPAGG